VDLTADIGQRGGEARGTGITRILGTRFFAQQRIASALAHRMRVEKSSIFFPVLELSCDATPS
jgi:hypothetical protein